MSGSLSTTAMSEIRPLLTAGPILRHFRFEKCKGSKRAGAAVAGSSCCSAGVEGFSPGKTSSALRPAASPAPDPPERITLPQFLTSSTHLSVFRDSDSRQLQLPPKKPSSPEIFRALETMSTAGKRHRVTLATVHWKHWQILPLWLKQSAYARKIVRLHRGPFVEVMLRRSARDV